MCTPWVTRLTIILPKDRMKQRVEYPSHLSLHNISEVNIITTNKTRDIIDVFELYKNHKYDEKDIIIISRMEITFDTIIEMLVCLILLIHVILSNANKATRITDVRYT